VEVKAGYKQTEIGVIPEDWEALPLPNTVWFQEGPGLRNWQFRPNGLKVINVTNLQGNGYLDLSTTERHISWEECDRTCKHFLIDDGDVVVASSGNSYCKVAVVRKSDLPLLINTSVIRFKAKTKISRSFMLTYLKSKYFKAQIDLMITGGAQPNFGPFHLRKVFIPSPPTKDEQEAIAEALSDADALIESLEQLLTKKRQLKQGAMQELLTGKKRLPGFSGKWDVRQLAQVAPLQRGFDLPNPQLRQGPYPVVYSNGVLNHHNAFQVKGPGVVTGRSGTIGSVIFVDQDFWPHNTSLWVTSFKDNDPRFVYYLYKRIGLERFATGSGVPTLNRNDVHAFKVKIPAIKTEQSAIAAILSNMDAEIAALEAKLTKARQLKQGMMQELLTGRIRLIVDSGKLRVESERQ
jgi:type I restriction enzyme, S subunit